MWRYASVAETGVPQRHILDVCSNQPQSVGP
jgi:hypothetical protein